MDGEFSFAMTVRRRFPVDGRSNESVAAFEVHQLSESVAMDLYRAAMSDYLVMYDTVVATQDARAVAADYLASEMSDD